MNKERAIDQRKADNLQNGYYFVAQLESGLGIWKKQNEVGGWIYFGESCGVFTKIFDTALSSKDEFLAVAKDAYGLEEDYWAWAKDWEVDAPRLDKSTEEPNCLDELVKEHFIKSNSSKCQCNKPSPKYSRNFAKCSRCSKPLNLPL